MATLNDIECYKGEAITLLCTMSPVVDITGWTITMTIRLNDEPDSGIVLQKTPGTLVAPTSGQFSFALSKAETVALNAGIFAYDMQRVDGSSEANLSIGTFTVKPSVLYP